MVVIAMKNIDYLFCSFTFRDPMENKAMGHVFKKGPEKHASQKCKRYSQNGVPKMIAAIVQHNNNDRQIDSPDHKRVRFRQHLEILTFEKPRLSFIMNFFEIHTSQFSTAKIN